MKLVLAFLSYINYGVMRSKHYDDLVEYLAARENAKDLKLRNVLNFEKGVGIIQRGMHFKFRGKKYYLAKTQSESPTKEIVGSFGMLEFITPNEAAKYNNDWFALCKKLSDSLEPDMTLFRHTKGQVMGVVKIENKCFLLMEWL